MYRLLFLFSLLGFATVFRLPEIRLLCLIVVDYASFCVLYSVTQKRHSRSFAQDCRALVGRSGG
jgi:hypothetical protein